MSVKTENHWGMLKDIWKIMWPAALPLYLSYFYYRFVGVYTSGLLGQIMDLLLYRNGNLADSRLFLKLALAFLFSLLLMPSVDFLTNIVIFRKGLRYEASVVDRIFRKDYEAFGSCQSAEWAARVSSDPLTYRNMAILSPVRLLADGTVFLTALYASLQRDARLALLLTAGIWLSIALRFFFRKWDNRFLNARQDWQNRVKARQAAIVRAHSFWLSYGCAASLPQRMKKRFGQFHRETGGIPERGDGLRPERAGAFAVSGIPALRAASGGKGQHQRRRFRHDLFPDDADADHGGEHPHKPAGAPGL